MAMRRTKLGRCRREVIVGMMSRPPDTAREPSWRCKSTISCRFQLREGEGCRGDGVTYRRAEVVLEVYDYESGSEGRVGDARHGASAVDCKVSELWD